MKTMGYLGLGMRGELYTPRGARICVVPFLLGCVIQRAQHWFARRWNEIAVWRLG